MMKFVGKLNLLFTSRKRYFEADCKMSLKKPFKNKVWMRKLGVIGMI